MRWSLPLLALIGAASLLEPAAAAGEGASPVAVARPALELRGQTLRKGIVFFLRVPAEPGAAAVGTAHHLALGELASAGELRFEGGHSGRRIALSSRLLVPPGWPFSAAQGRVRDDYLVFALDLPPEGARPLEAAPALPRPGTRVRLLGIPAEPPHDEDDVFGTVASATPERLEVDLDVKVDLRGWGGAPVLDDASGAALGILQAALPRERGLAIVASPIGAVLEALAHPLEGGLGLPFAAAAALAPAPSTDAAEPAGTAPESTGTSPEPETARAAPPAQEAGPPSPATRDRGGPEPPPASLPAPTESRAAVARDLAGAIETGVLRLEIEQPADGAIFGDALGAFVAGRAVAPVGEFRAIDVAFVIDTSQSTAEPSGADVNGNGVVSEPRFGPFGATDPGDSILAAEVAAARHFVSRLDPRSTRVAVITFAGEPEGTGGGILIGGGHSGPPARTEVPLTTDYEEVERALDRILERGPAGSTHMAAGADHATIELLGLRGAHSDPRPGAEKIAVLLTDGVPTLPYGGIYSADNNRAVVRAADRATRAKVRFHTVGIGPEALEGPVAIVELARRTGGAFLPVRDPADLVDVIAEVSFLDIEAIEVVNESTGAEADPVLRDPDGTWSALVPLRVGANRLRALARTRSGEEASGTITVHYAPGAPDPVLPPELVAERNALLERRLIALRRERIDLEREEVQKTRRELQLEIERERAQAEARAEEQRKELELEAERDEPRRGSPRSSSAQSPRRAPPARGSAPRAGGARCSGCRARAARREAPAPRAAGRPGPCGR
jgi:hypothetical protein